MAKSIAVNQNVRRRGPGRPATGRDPVLAFRLPIALKKRVEKEAETNGEKPADTLRRIVDHYFKEKRTNGR